MSNEREPVDDIEALLSEIAATPEERALILEEHRLLEKDLSRLSDPLPPPDFVQKVMVRVESAEAIAPSRGDRVAAMVVLVVSLGGAALAASSSGSLSSGLGSRFAQVLVLVRSLGVAAFSAGSAIWNTAAVPLSITVVACMALSVVALRRWSTASAVR